MFNTSKQARTIADQQRRHQAHRDRQRAKSDAIQRLSDRELMEETVRTLMLCGIERDEIGKAVRLVTSGRSDLVQRVIAGKLSVNQALQLFHAKQGTH
jgi:hypothetical protein